MTDADPAATADALLELTIAAQRRAADPRRSVFARANAGAGKTKVLVDRIARLLLDGADPGRILAITYTKAAAAEMQTRLFGQLGRWTVAPETVLRTELRALDPALQLDDARLRTARALFARALETPGGLKVQTIHAFCQAVLRRFPLEAGVAPGFDVAQGGLAELIADQAWAGARRAAPEAFAILSSLTSSATDRALVEDAARQLADPDAPIFQDPDRLGAALAAAVGLVPRLVGTDPMQLRLAALQVLIDLLAEAQPVLAGGGKTDTDKAAALAAALEAWRQGDRSDAWAGVVGLLFDNKKQLRRSAFGTKSVASHPALVALTGAWDKESGYSGPLQTLIDAELTARKIELVEASRAITQAAIAWHQAMRRAKTELGLLDFDDLLDRTAALLSAGEGAAQWVLYKLDQGIDHVLLDEAQDTSPRQWDLLAPLLAALEDGPAARARTRFVVGDEKQSIYSFQGARPERFLAEEQGFASQSADEGGPPRETVRFELSFRTGQTVLDAVDHVWAVCGPQAQSLEPEDETKFVAPRHHFARRTGAPGVVELWPITQPPEEKEQREAWDMPLDAEREASARNKLAERVASEIAARIARGDVVHDSRDGVETARPLQPGDIMVLVQRRGPLFHQIIRRLKARSIPVAGADRIRLVDDVGVQDLLALARFALCPGDDFNLACVLKGAFCGLVDDDSYLFPLAYKRGADSLWTRLQARRDLPFGPVAAFLADLIALAGALGPFEFLSTVLEQPLPDGRTGWQALIERLGREVREPVEALLQRALEAGRSSAPGLAAFLAEIEALDPDVKRELDHGSTGVRVMSVHGAKGLEAPLVILPDCTSIQAGRAGRLFPDPASGALLWPAETHWMTGALDEMAEARKQAAAAERARLLYVAMTRARDHLIIAGAWSGKRPGQDADSGEAKPGKKGPTGFDKLSWYDWASRGLGLMAGHRTVQIDPVGRDGPVEALVWGTAPAAIPPGTAGPDMAGSKGAPVPDWARRNAPAERAPIRRIAPSALVQDGHEPVAVSPARPEAAQRLLRGALVHQLLQRLPDVPAVDRKAAAERFLSRAGSRLEPGERAGILADVLAVLDHPQLADLFGPGSRAEVAVTGTGPGLPPGLVVAGTVDRLVVRARDVLVVDYKTNRLAPATADDVSTAYLAQMAAYRAVLAAAWPGYQIRCALVWTDGPKLMELPGSLLDEALAGLYQ